MSIVSLLMVPPSQQDMVAIAEESHKIRLAGKFLTEVLGFTQQQAISILAIEGVPERVCCIMVGKKVEKLEGRLARLNAPQELVRTGEGVPKVEPIVIQQKQTTDIIPQIGEKFLQKDEILSCPGLSPFFQEKINTLVNEGASTWQQRMDVIITLWNRQHKDAQVYKYIQKSEGKKAGDTWKENYMIEGSLDFQTLFGVTFPDWMQPKKKGRNTTNGPSLTEAFPEVKKDVDVKPPQAVGDGFPGFVTPGALEAHSRLGIGKKDHVTDGLRKKGSHPKQRPLKDAKSSIVRVPANKDSFSKKPLPPTIEITDKKERKEHACNVFNDILTQALTEYAKVKTLTWKTSQFTGIPTVASGHLRTEFSEKTTTLLIQGSHENEYDIWNAFQANDFIQIMKRRSGASYKEGERKYILKTDTGTLILALPARFQRKKSDHNNEEVGPTIYTSTEKMNAMKHDLFNTVDDYLRWYYREHKLNEKEIQAKEFLIENLPTQFRTRMDANNTFLLEGSFPEVADYHSLMRRSLIDALHDVPEVQRFLLSHPSESRFILDTKKGEKQNITFILEGKDGKSKVIFHPYLSK